MGSKLSSSIFCLLIFASTLEAQWITPPGKSWIDLSVFHQDTKKQFWFDGKKILMFEEGHLVASSGYLTGSYGIRRGVDAWIQLPLIRTRFDDFADNRVSTGIGDPRLFLRIGPQLFSDIEYPIALRFGIKAPIGSFERDAEIIPLGEGQFDFEGHLEVGHSFGKANHFTSLSLGYRHRLRNTESGIKPGDELLVLASFGTSYGLFLLDILAEALIGKSPNIHGLQIETAKRRLVHITPRIGYALPGADLKLGLRLPLAGRNLPAGRSLYFGLFRRF